MCNKNASSVIVKLASILLLTLLTACTSTEVIRTTSTTVQERYVPADPGAVEYVYEPPIVDVIDVPPGLDPEGIYYLPGHQSVVEIKQGRWQYYRQGQ